MPFRSKAQRRKFYSDPKLKKYVKEWESATKNKKLPERVSKTKSHVKKTKNRVKKVRR